MNHARAAVPTKAEEKVPALLRARGLRVTAPRTSVLAALMRAHEPLPIEALAARVRGAHLVTVYRTVEALVRAGLVYRADFRDGKASYEYQPHHHHHVTCGGCGLREAVEVCAQESAARALGEATRFARIDSHVLEFFGTCRKCAAG